MAAFDKLTQHRNSRRLSQQGTGPGRPIAHVVILCAKIFFHCLQKILAAQLADGLQGSGAQSEIARRDSLRQGLPRISTVDSTTGEADLAMEMDLRRKEALNMRGRPALKRSIPERRPSH